MVRFFTIISGVMGLGLISAALIFHREITHPCNSTDMINTCYSIWTMNSLSKDVGGGLLISLLVALLFTIIALIYDWYLMWYVIKSTTKLLMRHTFRGYLFYIPVAVYLFTIFFEVVDAFYGKLRNLLNLELFTLMICCLIIATTILLVYVCFSYARSVTHGTPKNHRLMWQLIILIAPFFVFFGFQIYLGLFGINLSNLDGGPCGKSMTMPCLK